MHGPLHHPDTKRMSDPHGLESEGVDSSSRAVFTALRSAMLLQKRLMLKTLAGRDVHPAQALCLGALAHRDGMSQSEIAEMMHVTRPTVTSMLQRLEAAGVIERRDDESDQRITRVFLTEEGRRTAADLHAVQAQTIGVSIGRMSDADRAELARLLSEMNDHLREALDAAPESEVRP